MRTLTVLTSRFHLYLLMAPMLPRLAFKHAIFVMFSLFGLIFIKPSAHVYCPAGVYSSAVDIPSRTADDNVFLFNTLLKRLQIGYGQEGGVSDPPIPLRSRRICSKTEKNMLCFSILDLEPMLSHNSDIDFTVYWHVSHVP